MKHSAAIPTRDNTALIIIDVQERLLPVISEGDELIRNVNILISGARIIGIPLLFTEQYPKGLGPTCASVQKESGDQVVEKISFSCMGNSTFVEEIKKLNANHLILAGAEAHICVLNTALDALDQNYTVHLVADAVSSLTPANRHFGIERLRQSGAMICTTEMILFQLLKQAGTDTFKRISKLIK
ncbi:hydrolase [Membranicola marinus]|uniref:Hydrolase n=1 Tax=Membranihabitans marinus TaxID=1227546 RepID=A0A953LBA9_9BACT|nr:hydrolase [Membranihabitans marinus]MBY5959563.1 hydrolase [Membranihabitans marinus]